MAVRYVKVFLVISVGIWGLLGTIGNLSGLPEVYGEVSKVTTMSGVPEGIGPPWRTSNPVVVSLGVVSIVLGKIAALFGGAYGGILMLRNVRGTTEAFARAKRWPLVGCGLAFGLTILSFAILAEGAFFMFYDARYVGAAELAFRLTGSFALIALFVAQPEPA